MNAGHLSKCILTSSFLKCLDLLEKNNYTVSIYAKLFARFVFLAVAAAHSLPRLLDENKRLTDLNVFIVVCYCKNFYMGKNILGLIFHINTVKVNLLIFYLNVILLCNKCFNSFFTS